MARTPSISAEHFQRIQALAPRARLARHQQAHDHPNQEASRELTSLFLYLRSSPTPPSIQNLADAAGISYHSVASRLRKGINLDTPQNSHPPSSPENAKNPSSPIHTNPPETTPRIEIYEEMARNADPLPETHGEVSASSDPFTDVPEEDRTDAPVPQAWKDPFA